ncbi:MAG: hypothetical protein Q9170_002268 [Blastenia crenularia]
MESTKWPNTPNLDGLPFDTALLISRDHVANLRSVYEQQKQSQSNSGNKPIMHINILLDLLLNLSAIHDTLCQRGPAQRAALDALADVKLSVQPVLGGSFMLRGMVQKGNGGNSVEMKDKATSTHLPSAGGNSSEASAEVNSTSPVNTSSALIDINIPSVNPLEREAKRQRSK